MAGNDFEKLCLSMIEYHRHTLENFGQRLGWDRSLDPAADGIRAQLEWWITMYATWKASEALR